MWMLSNHLSSLQAVPGRMRVSNAAPSVPVQSLLRRVISSIIVDRKWVRPRTVGLSCRAQGAPAWKGQQLSAVDTPTARPLRALGLPTNSLPKSWDRPSSWPATPACKLLTEIVRGLCAYVHLMPEPVEQAGHYEPGKSYFSNDWRHRDRCHLPAPIGQRVTPVRWRLRNL